MDRCQISFIKFILEAYDNLAVMSTVDTDPVVVQIAIAPGCETLVDDIMHDLSTSVAVIPVDEPAPTGPGRAKGGQPAAQHASMVNKQKGSHFFS